MTCDAKQEVIRVCKGTGLTYVMGGPWMAAMAGAKVRYREWLKTGERMLAMTASSSG